jgi:hypothetical protein
MGGRLCLTGQCPSIFGDRTRMARQRRRKQSVFRAFLCRGKLRRRRMEERAFAKQRGPHQATKGGVTDALVIEEGRWTGPVELGTTGRWRGCQLPISSQFALACCNYVRIHDQYCPDRRRFASLPKAADVRADSGQRDPFQPLGVLVWVQAGYAGGLH